MNLDWCCCLAFSLVYRIFNHLLKIVLNFYRTFFAVSGFLRRERLLVEKEGIYIYWIRDRTTAFLMGCLMVNSGNIASSCLSAFSNMIYFIDNQIMIFQLLNKFTFDQQNIFMRSVNNPQTFHTTQSYYQPSVQVGQQQTQNQPTYLQAKQTQQNIQSPSHLIGRPSNQHMKEEPMRQQQMKEQFLQQVKDYVFPEPYVKYKIMPAEEDKKTLDVTTIDNPDKQLKKGNIIIWDYHGGPNQHWYIKSAGGNNHYLINVATGFTLQVPDGSRQNDIQVHTNPRNNTENQMWQLVNCGKNLYKIKSFCGKILDVSSAWIRDGGKVIQYDDHDGKNQKWKIWPS